MSPAMIGRKTEYMSATLATWTRRPTRRNASLTALSRQESAEMESMSPTMVGRKTEYMSATLATWTRRPTRRNASLTALSRQESAEMESMSPTMCPPKDGIHVCYVGHLDAEANAPQRELDGFKPSRSIS